MSLTLTGSLENEVMLCIWEHNERTVREIYSCISKKRKIAYTTVMTVMGRLVKKGLLKRKKQGKFYVYSPKLSKKQTVKKILHQAITFAIDRWGSEAFAAFAEEISELTPKEKKKLLKRLKEK